MQYAGEAWSHPFLLCLKNLLAVSDIVKHTLKTNIYMNDRYSIGLRLDPKIMETKGQEPRDTPYGIIFSHGRRFDGKPVICCIPQLLIPI